MTSISGVTYSWSPATGLSSSTVSNPTANPTTTTTYTLTATNTSNGCTATDQVIVTVNNTPPVANAGADFTKTCTQNPNGLQIGATAVSGITYSWSPTTDLSSSSLSNPTANPTTTTTYTLTATNPANGCTANDQVIVTVNLTIPTANAGTDFTKNCSQNPTCTTIFTSSVAGVSYVWRPSTCLSSPTLSNPLPNSSSTFSYTVIVSITVNVFIAPDFVVLTIYHLPPTANAGNDFTKTCTQNINGLQIGMSAISGVTYSWSTATGPSAAAILNPLPNPTTTTTYHLTSTNTTNGFTTHNNIIPTF